MTAQRQPRWILAMAVFAGFFGLMTVVSGGSVLLSVGSARIDAGDYVPFVLWFNFLAGFAYVVVAVAIFTARPWAVTGAGAIAGASLLVLVAFLLHVLAGGPFETRTLGAMILRVGVWLGIAWVLYRRRAGAAGAVNDSTVG